MAIEARQSPVGEAESGGVARAPARRPPPAIAGDLRQARLRTDGLDEAEGRRAYLDRLDGILDTEFLQPFAARLDAWRLGPFSLLHLGATARRSTRTAARIAQDRYDPIGVQYIVSGRATGTAAGRPVTSEPGMVMILDYAQPFSITDHEPREVINVAVSRSLFPAGQRNAADWHGAILSGSAAVLLSGFLTALAARLPELPATSGPSLADALVALLAVALDEEKAAAPDPDARLIRRAENLVDDRIGSPELGPAWLSARLGVSRSELYAALERFGGVSRFILQRRLVGARAALCNPQDARRIREIAFAFGFGSEAHFARAFRATFGMTASEARRRRPEPDG